MTTLPFSTAAGPSPCPHGEISSPLGASPHLPAPLTPLASSVTHPGWQEAPASTFQQKKTTFPSNFCHVTGGSTKAVSSDASRLSLQQSRALPFGKKEHFPRKAQIRALLALVASVLFIRLLQKHLDGWSSAPCALTESGSHEPTLGRTKGRSVWVGAARRGCCTTPSRASRQQNQPEPLLLAPRRAPSSVSLPQVAPLSLCPDAGLLQRSR